MSTKIVCFDFDGVIHPYKNGFQGIGKTPNPPIIESVEAIRRLRRRGYKVIVVSSRCTVPIGMRAVKRYLKENHIDVDDVTGEKLDSDVYIDDRAICYKPGMNLYMEIKHFMPWWKDDVEEIDDEEIDDTESMI